MSTDSGWRFSGEEPMFIPRDEMQEARRTFEREAAEAMANGEHYLMALVGFRVDIRQESSLLALTQENLRMPPNIGCILCEATYDPDMDPRCPGEPVG